MTKDEALKLALEALEASHFLIHGSETKGGLAFCMDGYYSSCFDIDSNDKQTNEAITAIKDVLAQPNFCPRCGKRLGTNDWDIHTCTPPQRKPLTDEAIATVYWGATGQSLRPQDNVLAHNFARSIEAAHGITGEKNGTR